MPRVAVTVRGVVQGVGMRPFVYRAATARGLSGWVHNDAAGLALEIEGPGPAIESFLAELRAGPEAGRVDGIEVEPRAERSEAGFRIVASDTHGEIVPSIPADLALCDACAAEVTTLGERRHGYAFTNCTECGPRFTIVAALPYDRARTSMHGFAMCEACSAEYADVGDRRSHPPPSAAPRGAPRRPRRAAGGAPRARGAPALELAALRLAAGDVLAMKGLGGFQLLADATSSEAVAALRRRKHRDEKPFAVMFPSLDAVRLSCAVSDAEAAALRSREAPIVLLERLAGAPGGVVSEVAPDNALLGALLPYTPLHLLLMRLAARPLVCTSGNLSGEPMCIDEREALERLGAIADVLLVHDRPIVRPVDDSVARVGPRGLELLRRARGFAPHHVAVAHDGPDVLALGGHLKATVTVLSRGRAVVSQHLGDLDTLEGLALVERTAADLVALLGARPAVVACDLHPDYASTRVAERLASELGARLERVQHHHAHVAACVAEHGLEGEVLGLAWDGAGFGPDGAVWGGEAILAEGARWTRFAHLAPFPLPGGEHAVREPRRAALGLLWEVLGEDAAGVAARWFERAELGVLMEMLRRRVGSPLTSSIGRLFDAVAAIAGLRARASFEGQAAMALEHAARGASGDPAYPVDLGGGEPGAAGDRSAPIVASVAPMIRAILAEVAAGTPPARIAARFHATLAELAEAIAVRAGAARVVLSGGCFQNARLSAEVRRRLCARGLEVYAPVKFPPNDGGLSLGQAFVAARRAAGEEGGDVPRRAG